VTPEASPIERGRAGSLLRRNSCFLTALFVRPNLSSDAGSASAKDNSVHRSRRNVWQGFQFYQKYTAQSDDTMRKRNSHGRDLRNSRRVLSVEDMLWNWMAGSLIGLVGAALLLVARPGSGAMLFAGTPMWLSKLLVLALCGFCCGCGAALTGAIFILVER
jgi:hypothetical protein